MNGFWIALAIFCLALTYSKGIHCKMGYEKYCVLATVEEP